MDHCRRVLLNGVDLQLPPGFLGGPERGPHQRTPACGARGAAAAGIAAAEAATVAAAVAAVAVKVGCGTGSVMLPSNNDF